MRTLFFDCFSGISGNMILGALVAAGIEQKTLIAEIEKLGISDFELEVSIVNRSGISATHVAVKVADENKHRHLKDIKGIISASTLHTAIKERSIAIFTRLAEAEAKIHGIDREKVHFHEVGALDAIIDIVGACIGFDMLGIEKFACSRIHVGSGFVQIAHGKFPVPSPAVTELLAGIPIYSTEIEGELATPTGAAIISTICEVYGQLPNIEVETTAYGAGSRSYEKFPNVLRILIGSTAPARTIRQLPDRSAFVAGATLQPNQLFLLETNIDDLSPQVLGFVMDRVFERGALDCWFTPIQMKKNRPAVMLSVLCDDSKREKLTETIFRETTTLGIRFRLVDRDCIERESIRVQTQFGAVDVKIARQEGNIVNAMPEYDQVKALAVDHDIAFHEVWQAAIAALDRASAASTE